MGDVNVTKIEDKEFVALEDFKTATAKVGVLENVVREYQDLVHTEKGNVERLQEEIKSLEDFKKKKVEVESLKAKNEALKKNLLAVENREKARADAEIEKRVAEIEAEIDNRVSAKTAEAGERIAEAEGRVAEAERLVEQAKALEADFERRVSEATKAFKEEASTTAKDALARIIDAQKKAAQDILKSDRLDRALHGLKGVFNYIDKGKSLNPRDVVPTVKQIAKDALEADEKLVTDAEDAKKAAQIVEATPAPVEEHEIRCAACEEDPIKCGNTPLLIHCEPQGELPDMDSVERVVEANFEKIEKYVAAATKGFLSMEEILKDPHTAYARKMFGLGPDDPVTPEQRSEAKATLFGVLYGFTRDEAASVAEPEGEQPDLSKIVCVEEMGTMRFNPDAVVAAVLDPEKTSEKPEETPSEPTGEVPAV